MGLAFYFTFQVACRLCGALCFYLHFWGYFYWKMKSVARRNKEAWKKSSETITAKMNLFFEKNADDMLQPEVQDTSDNKAYLLSNFYNNSVIGKGVNQ